MVISKEFYCDMKDYFYPNIRKFIHNYTCIEDNLFFLPPYHGCGLKNKNGSKKSIDYRNGKQCLSPSWKQVKYRKYKYHWGIAYTRYMSFNNEKVRTFFKSKGNSIFNYRTNQFDHLSITPIGDQYHRFVEFKDCYLSYYRK